MAMNVFRLDFWLNKVFDENLSKDPAINLKVCKQADTDEVNLGFFKIANIYHIHAARDEVPPQWHVTEELLSKCPDLICVSTSGAGYDPVDVDACTKNGVLVVNQSGGNSDSVAEHTLSLILDVKHRITESDRVMRAHQCGAREDLMGNEVRGLTLGLVGIGQIGRRVALLAKAFGMNVIAYDPYVNDGGIKNRGAKPVSFDELLTQADIISLHCPRNSQTLNLFNAKVFAAMKTGATLISTARGGIHNEADLHDALKNKKLSGAGLDVWAIEPPEIDNLLLTLPNVVATYHTGGVTHEARYNGAKMAADQIQGLVRGEQPLRMINPEVWPLVEEKLHKLLAVA